MADPDWERLPRDTDGTSAAREREAFYDATVRYWPDPTAEERRTADLKDFGAALVASDLWPPGPTRAEVEARHQAAYDRADTADPYFGLTPVERDAAVHASWDLPAADAGLEAAS